MEGSCDAPSLLSDSLHSVACVGTLALWNEKTISTDSNLRAEKIGGVCMQATSTVL